MLMMNTTPPEPYLTFWLAGQAYALPIARVIEIAGMVELITLPDARPILRGIANRHGQPLPILDLRQAFGGEPLPIVPDTLFIVAADAQRIAGLAVDKVDGVHYYGQVHPVHGERFITGVIADADHVIQVIALPTLLEQFVPGAVREKY